VFGCPWQWIGVSCNQPRGNFQLVLFSLAKRNEQKKKYKTNTKSPKFDNAPNPSTRISAANLLQHKSCHCLVIYREIGVRSGIVIPVKAVLERKACANFSLRKNYDKCMCVLMCLNVTTITQYSCFPGRQDYFITATTWINYKLLKAFSSYTYCRCEHVYTKAIYKLSFAHFLIPSETC
jgi:hypothetical protein